MKVVNADLELRELTKHYGVSPLAVDAISLSIASGELVSLLGPSGCGKTTTLRMIAGLVLQTSGNILINGISVARQAVHERNIGMVFQNYALFPHMSIAENVAFGLRMRKLQLAERTKRVKEALEIVQLGAFANRTPHELSGGQQQRVALARALVIEPSVLLLDEPLGALDKNLREDMQVELRRIQKNLGITTVIVTHDQEEALTLSDRIVIMNGGKIEQVGTPEQIYCQPQTRFVAGFIGNSNFLEGDVISVDEHGSSIHTLEVGWLRVSGRLVPGSSVALALRPEDIELKLPGQGGSGTPNQVACTIKEVLYKGFVSHLYVLTDSGKQMLVSLQNSVGDGGSARYATGDRYLASWRADSNIVLA